MSDEDWERISNEAVRAYIERRHQDLFSYLKAVAHRRLKHTPVVGLEASDLVQRTWVATFAALKRGAGPKEGQSVEFWLQDRLLNVLKQERRIIRRLRVFVEVEPVDSATTPGSQLAKAELIRLIDTSLGNLGEETQEMIRSWCFEGLSRAEIARRLGRGVPYVRKTTRNALAMLRSTLRDWDASAGRESSMLDANGSPST